MLIRIHVTTDAKKESVMKRKDDMPAGWAGCYEITLREPAEDNRANKRILELVRGRYPGMRIRMMSGHRRPTKIISLEKKS